MRLIDHYHNAIAGQPVKETKAIRSRWHQATKRHCHYRWLTSDPLPPPSVRRVHEDANDETSPTYPVTTVVFDPFFKLFSDEELEEVYRITKPRGY